MNGKLIIAYLVVVYMVILVTSILSAMKIFNIIDWSWSSITGPAWFLMCFFAGTKIGENAVYLALRLRSRK